MRTISRREGVRRAGVRRKGVGRRVCPVVLVALLTLFVAATPRREGRPRNMLRTNQLDTLTFSERLAWRTNALGWLLLSPNIGAELTLGRHNWSQWTVGATARAWWANNDWKVPYMVHNIKEVRGEVRRYRHGRGLRRSWFWGVYGGYSDFNLKVDVTGYRGKAMMAGATGGTIAPLYGYPNGSSLDLEVSANLGLLLGSFEEYQRKNYVYVVTRPRGGWRLVTNPLPYVGNTDMVRVSLVYRVGPSVADRYRDRIKIDERYRMLQDELALKRDSTEQANLREKARRRDSLDRVDYERRFEQQRQELERKHLRDSLARVKTARYEK